MSKLPTPDDKASKTDKCTQSDTAVAKLGSGEFDAIEINTLQGENDEAIATNTSGKNSHSPTPRRRRTVKAAKKVIADASYPSWKRSYAYARIRKAKQPVREAKAIVARHRADRHKIELTSGRAIDLSDVQELRVKLIRRDYGVWSPHTDYLNRMERDILSGTMTASELKRRSTVLFGMKQPLSKKFRKAEWLLSRIGEQNFPATKKSKYPHSNHMILQNPKSWLRQPQRSPIPHVPSEPISDEENAALLDIPEFLKCALGPTSEEPE